ncbi:MAG: ABC transporter substrate-binding protein [Actinomycetia bacterium]|nr:ABC transporter substrate-binding protein [Actinomycetes bacterium]
MSGKKSVALLCVFALLVSLGVAVAACGEGEEAATTAAPTTATTGGTETTTAPVGETKTLKIGGIMGLTGPLSIPSLAFMRGWEIYADVVKEAGGVKIGNDTYMIEIIEEDSKGAAEGATTAASKLVNQDQVQFVMGAMLETEVAAIYSVTQPAGVLYATANINIPEHASDVSPDKDLFVRLAVSPDENQPLDLDYLRENYPDAVKIGVSQPDIGYEGMFDRLKASAEKRGMEVVHAEKWAWGTTDFIPTYTNIVASKPDIIFAMNSGQANDQLKAARQLGFTGPFVSNSPLGADVFLVTVQDPTMLTDVICNSPDVTHPNDAMKALMDRWTAKWPNDGFVSDAVHAYDIPWILVQAMQKAGSTDPAVVLATLEAMTNRGDLQTNEGPGYMGGQDRFGVNRVLYRPFPITRIMNGELEFAGFFDPIPE